MHTTLKQHNLFTFIDMPNIDKIHMSTFTNISICPMFNRRLDAVYQIMSLYLPLNRSIPPQLAYSILFNIYISANW